jgi:hypothetical protein
MKAAKRKSKHTLRPSRAVPRQQDETGWRLISGQRLVEFVIRAGLVAPRLLAPAPKE